MKYSAFLAAQLVASAVAVKLAPREVSNILAVEANPYARFLPPCRHDIAALGTQH